MCSTRSTDQFRRDTEPWRHWIATACHTYIKLWETARCSRPYFKTAHNGCGSCHGLDMKWPHKLMHLNAWSRSGGAVLEIMGLLGGGALTEGCVLLEPGLTGYSLHWFPPRFPVYFQTAATMEPEVLWGRSPRRSHCPPSLP